MMNENSGISSFAEELRKNVVETPTRALSDKEIILELLEGQGLNNRYKTNERATDEIVSVCKEIAKNRFGDKIDFSNVGEDDIKDLRVALSDLVTTNGNFNAVVNEYRREDEFGTPDSPDRRQLVGKTVKSISIPDENGDFYKITDKLDYISSKGNYSVGTEIYNKEVEKINKDGIVMEKRLGSASRDDRDATSDMQGVQPRFEGAGSYDEKISMKRYGDSIMVTKEKGQLTAALTTRNDTRYNESDINVPYQAMEIVDARIEGKSQSEIEQMYENLSPYYKEAETPEIREAQKKETAERISKDKYGKGLEEYYKKAGYRESDFDHTFQKE